MKKFLSLTMAIIVAGAMISISVSDADAGRKGRRNTAIALGVLGGLAVGAAIAGSNRRGYRRSYSNRHCHARYCHRHNYRYSDHRHRPAVYNPPPRRRPAYAGNAHVNWCYRKYRSYRDYDNTFQPYNGRRRQCYSPYN
jgi:hypothetical protein